ncbi:hypothetical protein V8F33_003398 [Rhypophila sp. PSN 637]
MTQRLDNQPDFQASPEFTLFNTLITFMSISETCRVLRAVGRPFLYHRLDIRDLDLRPGRRGWKLVKTFCNRPDLRASVFELDVHIRFGPVVAFELTLHTPRTEGLKTGALIALLIQLAPNLRRLSLYADLASLRRLEVWLSETQFKSPFQIHCEYNHPGMECDGNSVTCQSAYSFHCLWTKANSLKPLCDSAPRLRYLRLEEDHAHMEHDREWSLEELSPLLTRWAASLEILYLGSALTILNFAPRPQAALSFPNLTELILDYKLPHPRLDEMAQHTEVLAALLKTIGPSLAKCQNPRFARRYGAVSKEATVSSRGVISLGCDESPPTVEWNAVVSEFYSDDDCSSTSSFPDFQAYSARYTPYSPATPRRPPLLLADWRFQMDHMQRLDAAYWDALVACLSGQYLKRLTFVGPYRPPGIPVCNNLSRVLFREHVKGILGLEDTCGLFRFSDCGRMHGPSDQSSGLRAGMGVVDSVELDNLDMITYESPGEDRITDMLKVSGDVMEVTTLLGSKVKVRVTNEMEV